MTDSEIILCIIKLVLGGIAAFLAIMLWSRTREPAWICLVAGAVTGYAGIVYELLVKLGIVFAKSYLFPGTEIPLSTLFFTIVPLIFVIVAFILMLIKLK